MPQGPAGAPSEPEAAELWLAAYLEGRLDEAEAERVEAWLAADPAALELMLAARGALAEPAETGAEVPAALLGRARGLVHPGAQAERRSWAERLLGGFGGLLQPVGVAAAVLLACAIGAGLGQSSFANMAETQSQEAEVPDLGLSGDEIF